MLQSSLEAATPLLVVTSVLAIVFFTFTVVFYIMFQRAKKRLNEETLSRERTKLFPETSYVG